MGATGDGGPRQVSASDASRRTPAASAQVRDRNAWTDKSFYFRGPEGSLRLRAQNLGMFLQMADGVDDDTWTYHLQRGDYSAWIREAIKDNDLAREVADVETKPDLSAEASRVAVTEAIERRYTAPG